MSTKPWQIWAINPKQGVAMKEPVQLAKIIKKASRPLIVVGALADEIEVHDGKTILDILIELGKKIPVVATAHISKKFLEKGYTPAAIMTAVNITNRLSDPEWKGLDGKGQYDLVIYTGMTIYLELQMLSRLKHYAKGMKTISLERFFIPNADIGLANLKVEKWKEGMKAFMDEMKS
ncbi:MAG: CO dehydrogenase/acetyl-CoA synthase complex subunit epsilon [Candidatus Helarchaeota archaeon]